MNSPIPKARQTDREVLEAFLEAQDALDNRELNGINAEDYFVLLRRRNRARADLEAALSAPPQEVGVQDFNTAPHRAFRITLMLDADDRASMANALYNIARRVEREELSHDCISGGPDSGFICELLHDPAMTHAAYFEAIRGHLGKKEQSA